MGTSTPWGTSDYKSPVTRGINFYGTPSHGGYCVSNGKAAKMHPALASMGIESARGLWFEEDCAYSAVYLAFPEHFEAEKVKGAHETCRSWCPDEYAAAFGVTVTEEESFVLRERAFKKKTKNDFVVKSAAGSWHKCCPENFVLVYAVRASDGHAKNFLIPAAEYDARKGASACLGDGFVVDPSKHEEISPTVF